MMKNIAIVVAGLVLTIFSVPAASQTPECQTPPSPASAQSSRAAEPDSENRTGDRSQFQARALEILVGQRAAAEYETTVKLFCDDTVHEYVNRITQTVAHGSNVRVPVTVKVVDSSEANALSFPGGFLYINTGLILAVESEAEIASVVAHEIAHVVARDGMRRQTVVPDADSSTAVTPLPDGVNGMGQIGGYLIPLNNVGGRIETEADYNGIRYLQKSGYSPRALITFLERMLAREQTDPKSVLRMFQTHPPTRERIRGIGDRIGYPTESPGTDAELQRIKGIIERSLPQPVPSTSH